jgi:hypothetical protein
MVTAMGREALVIRAAPRHEVGVEINGNYSEALGQSSPPPSGGGGEPAVWSLPRVFGIGPSVNHTATVSARVRVGWSLGADYVGLRSYRLVTMRGIAVLGVALSRRADLRAEGGALVVRTLQNSRGELDVPLATPHASLGITGRLDQGPHGTLAGNILLTYSGYVDPILATVLPRLGVTAGIDAALRPRWTVGVQAGFFTVATREPPRLPGVVSPTFPLLLTIASVDVPVSYRFSDTLVFQFGSRLATRGPHIAAQDFEFSRHEAWVYVGVLTAYGSRGRGLEWAP